MTQVTLNTEQQLYVIPAGDGFTCWGFQNCFDECTQLAELLGFDPPTQEWFGTLDLYVGHGNLLNKANQRGLLNRTWFSLHTPPRVKEILEAARLHPDRQRLRLFLGDRTTGRDWMEENDVVGYIGRSTGMLKVPLLMVEKRSYGGAILTDCIVRIIDTATKRELWRHPQYHMPTLFVREAFNPEATKAGYTHEVMAGIEIKGRFKSETAANNYIAFMEGRRMRT